MAESRLLTGKADLYDGILIKSKDCSSIESDRESVLKESLEQWRREEKVTAVWFQVDIKDSEWVPLLTRNGFQFHHAQPDYVMMTIWISKQLSDSLPRYPFTSIGVGGLVVNDQGEILLMKEQRGIYVGWKYPGGLADPGEDLYQTAEREVLEETGVLCKATALLCFRHTHAFKWRHASDIYFICLLNPVDENEIEPRPCPREAAACQWMTREEIARLPNEEFHDFHVQILKKYDELMASGRRGCHAERYEVPQLNRVWTMYYMD